MQLDFWQYSEGPVERIVASIAERLRTGNERLLVVDANSERRAAISRALWESKPEAFLANGEASAPHSAAQPILLGSDCAATNGARTAVLADGEWRDAGESFDRTILLFGETQIADTRAVWRRFDGRDDVTRGYFAQEGGKWVKKM